LEKKTPFLWKVSLKNKKAQKLILKKYIIWKIIFKINSNVRDFGDLLILNKRIWDSYLLGFMSFMNI